MRNPSLSANPPISRRQFAKQLSLISTVAYYAPRTDLFAAEISQDRTLPNIPCGVASGDVNQTSATIWSRADRDSRMILEVAQDESFRNARKIVGPDALAGSDYTAKLRLNQLTPGQPYFYRVQFQDLSDLKKRSAPVTGKFTTAPTEARDVSFVWSGDTAGQGYGIDESRGGMQSFDSIRKLQPDFFVNSGDVIYADNPIQREVKLDDGSQWTNLLLEGKHKVAETVDEFRSNYRYNLLDNNLRRLNAEVPSLVQWDDHETLNNWYPGEILDDNRYQVKSVSLLAARAKQAFFEYLPIRSTSDGFSRIYRTLSYGPMLELFFLDLRSYRGPNSSNRQTEMNDESAYMGKQQLQWLKQKLKASTATWKVICSDMPIGLIIGDGRDTYEACANGNGAAAGRELEIANLLSFMKRESIHNTVWLTADVHYAASHYYDPNRATYQDFDPFWEFVSGPLHAGTFGPGQFDNTFGPQLRFKGIPDGMRANRPPSEGFQFFGHVQISKETKAMTVSHYNSVGKKLWSTEIAPAS